MAMGLSQVIFLAVVKLSLSQLPLSAPDCSQCYHTYLNYDVYPQCKSCSLESRCYATCGGKVAHYDIPLVVNGAHASGGFCTCKGCNEEKQSCKEKCQETAVKTFECEINDVGAAVAKCECETDTCSREEKLCQRSCNGLVQKFYCVEGDVPLHSECNCDTCARQQVHCGDQCGLDAEFTYDQSNGVITQLSCKCTSGKTCPSEREKCSFMCHGQISAFSCLSENGRLVQESVNCTCAGEAINSTNLDG